MSAIHIPAEAGRTYLMKDGEMIRVVRTRANIVTFTLYGFTNAWGRARFESMIESVLK